MEKKLITVTIPQDRTLLKVLMDLKDLINCAWLFIDDYAYRDLLKKSQAIPIAGKNCVSFNSFSDFPHAKVIINSERATIWKEIVEIDAFNICFRASARDPKKVFFFVTELPN